MPVTKKKSVCTVCGATYGAGVVLSAAGVCVRCGRRSVIETTRPIKKGERIRTALVH